MHRTFFFIHGVNLTFQPAALLLQIFRLHQRLTLKTPHIVHDKLDNSLLRRISRGIFFEKLCSEALVFSVIFLGEQHLSGI